MVVCHLNVAQCSGRSIIIHKTVTTVLEVNEGILAGSGVRADKSGQISYDLLELFEVDVVMNFGPHAKISGNFFYSFFVLDQKFG